MSKARVFKFLAPALTALIAAAACGDEEGDTGNNNASTTPGGSMTVTGPGGTAAPGTPQTPAGQTPAGQTPAGQTPGGATPAPGGTDPAATPEPETPSAAAMCMNTAEGSASIDGLSGATGVYTYGDGTCVAPTTHCIDDTTPGTLCFRGVAADAQSDYSCYGAGFGIDLAIVENSVVTTPWDATAAGVAGVQFTITGLTATSPALRVQIAQADLPEDAAFVHGSGTSDLKADGDPAVFMFADFGLPDWVTGATGSHPELADAVLDLTNLKGMQIQVTTQPNMPKEFDFCISNLAWVDAAGTPVALTPLAAGEPAAGAGGSDGMGAGGSDTGAGGSDTGAGGSDTGAGGQEGGAGGSDTGAGGQEGGAGGAGGSDTGAGGDDGMDMGTGGGM